jgi:hypothetical protein
VAVAGPSAELAALSNLTQISDAGKETVAILLNRSSGYLSAAEAEEDTLMESRRGASATAQLEEAGRGSPRSEEASGGEEDEIFYPLRCALTL